MRVRQYFAVYSLSGCFSVFTWMLLPICFVGSIPSLRDTFVCQLHKTLSLYNWSRKTQCVLTIPPQHSISLLENVFQFLSLILIVLCVGGDVNMLRHASHRLHVEVRGQICEVKFSRPTFTWILGIKLRSSGPQEKHLYLLPSLHPINVFLCAAFCDKLWELKRNDSGGFWVIFIQFQSSSTMPRHCTTVATILEEITHFHQRRILHTVLP